MTQNAIQPVGGREWWPVNFVDEVSPHGRATPDDWLCRLSDGAHAYGDPSGEDPLAWPIRVTEGGTVEFMAQAELGEATLTIEEDGTYRCVPEPPEDAYLYEVGNPEMGADGVAELVDLLREFGEAEGEYQLAMYRGSEATFRFTAIDGPPRFERVVQQ